MLFLATNIDIFMCTSRPRGQETTCRYWPASRGLRRMFLPSSFIWNITPEVSTPKEDHRVPCMASRLQGTLTGSSSNFIAHAHRECPLLLTCDGHKSHLTVEVIVVAKKEGATFLCFPPHCSHVLQRLDVGFFGPLKAEFGKVAGNLCHYNNSFVVNQAHFARVFRHPYQGLKDRGIVVEGFRKCGFSTGR